MNHFSFPDETFEKIKPSTFVGTIAFLSQMFSLSNLLESFLSTRKPLVEICTKEQRFNFVSRLLDFESTRENRKTSTYVVVSKAMFLFEEKNTNKKWKL